MLLLFALKTFFYFKELIEERRREAQAKRLKREKEQQEKMRQKQMEELERKAQYAAEAELKRERSEAILREREITLQKVSKQSHFDL